MQRGSFQSEHLYKLTWMVNVFKPQKRQMWSHFTCVTKVMRFPEYETGFEVMEAVMPLLCKTCMWHSLKSPLFAIAVYNLS